MRKTRIVAGMLLIASMLVLPAAADAAATPVSPEAGTKIYTDEVIVRWAFPPGEVSDRIEWSLRPDTSFPGGPFLEAEDADYLSEPDVAYLIQELGQGRYYWHVRTGVLDEEGFPTAGTFGPVTYFDIIPPISAGAARRHVREILRARYGGGIAREATVRCTQTTTLRAYCRFGTFLGDVELAGRGPVWYTDDVNDYTFHFRLRVMFRNWYAISVRRKTKRSATRYRTWRG